MSGYSERSVIPLIDDQEKREFVERVACRLLRDTGQSYVGIAKILDNYFERREAAEKAQDALEDAYQVVNNLMPLGEYDGLIDKIERAQMAYRDALKGGGESV